MANYPMAERPDPVNAQSVVACAHCKAPIAVSRWDRLNGFLVECPFCHGYHGRAWSMRNLGLISFLLNALSFAFTMRPARAAVAIVGWIVAFYLLLPLTERGPEWIQVILFGALLLGPLLMNAGLLVRHQMDLDRHPIAVRS